MSGIIRATRHPFSRSRIVIAALFLIAAVAVQPLPTHAAGTVVTVDDALDEIHDAGCATTGVGTCTLRDAILFGNAQGATASTAIDLPAGTYTLTIPGQAEDAARTGDLDINSNLTIIGAAVGTTIIQASATTPQNGIDRVLDILGGNVALSGLTIRNGNAPQQNDSRLYAGYGGGVRVSVPGTGIVSLTVTNCAISGNIAYSGGGLYIDNSVAGTKVTISDSTIANNDGGLNTGGILNYTGALTIIDSTIDNNRGYQAGGIYNNQSGGRGTVAISGSAITNNQGMSVGAIRNDGVVTVTNSTLDHNTSWNAAGGIESYLGGQVSLTNTTISASLGSGINILYGGPFTNVVTVRNSLLFQNQDDNGGVKTDANCDAQSGTTLTSLDHNLSSDATCAAFTQAHDLDITDPLLGPLANNGGTTQTRALLAGSPAIDAGGVGADGCPATDQRGFARPAGAACDIGAFEYGAVAASVAVTGISAQHRQYPSTTWTALATARTTDGNRIRVIGTVQNLAATDQAVAVDFRDIEIGAPLAGRIVSPACGASCTLAPNQSLGFTFEWDTAGDAWNDDGTPHAAPRQIAMRVNGFDHPAGAITVAPKPAILVHGLNETVDGEWGGYTDPTTGYLATAHPNWKGFSATGMDVSSSPTGKHVGANAQALAVFIESTRRSENAWHVDLVGHSMGGLISRYYIDTLMPASIDNRPVVHRLVMLGTPNLGSSCAAVGSGGYFVAWSLLSYLLGGPLGQPLPAPLYENTPSYVVNTFNPAIIHKNGVTFDNLAGQGQLTGAYGALSHACFLSGPNDGAVTVASAQAYSDLPANDPTATSPSNHFQENGAADFAAFVKPHLAIGPTAAATERAARPASPPAKPAVATASTAVSGTQVIGSGAAAVPSGGSFDVPLAVPAGTALGVTLIIPATADATLVDAGGATVASLPTGSARVGNGVQGLAVANPGAGQWRLHITNNDSASATVGYAAQIEGDGTTLALAPPQPIGRRVPVSVNFGNALGPITGAAVAATVTGVNGSTITIPLIGTGDGTYQTTTATLAPDTYTIAVTAQMAGTSRITTGDVTIGPPTVAAIAPSSGPTGGGAKVTITGTGFAGTVVGVTFGGAAAASVTMVSDTLLTATAPPHAAGTVDVTVTVDGVGVTQPGAYTYGNVAPLPPAQPSASPGGVTSPLPAPRPSGGTQPGGSPAPLPPSRP